ncbi:MAG: hypothetical protein SGARI_002098, partial [Bacillariaceae sp.]
MASGVVLYNALEFLSPKDTEFDYYDETGHDKRPLTLEQARLQAMIENAQKSSWQENLNNALVAQEKFILGNERGEKNPKFMKEIDQRSHQLMKEQQAKLQRERKDAEEDPKRRPTTTKF